MHRVISYGDKQFSADGSARLDSTVVLQFTNASINERFNKLTKRKVTPASNSELYVSINELLLAGNSQRLRQFMNFFPVGFSAESRFNVR